MSIELLQGIVIGGTVVLLILLVIIFGAGSANEKKAKRRGEEANHLLRCRNELGERQAMALEELQCFAQQATAWYGHYLTKERAEAPKERRERIATAALNGYLAGRMHDTSSMPAGDRHHQYVAASCLKYADSLIAELDEKGESNG